MCDFSCDKKWKLIYRASEHGFSAEDFHAKCDYIPNTVTIIKSAKGYIFGGFTSQTWNKSNTYKNDPNAFLFSLVNSENQPEKFKIKHPSNAIYCGEDFGPKFGYNDLCIRYKAKNYFYIGNSDSNCYKSDLLTDSIDFIISEIEIYQII